jgi:hypothetical protein
MTSDKTTIEEWIYAGERLDAKDKPYTVWIDPAGEELRYRKLHGGIPGQTYAAEIQRAESGITVHGQPRYLAEQATRSATPAQTERWRAETAAAKQILEAKRAEKAAGENDELQAALEVLRRHHSKLRSYAKKGAFASYVLGELQRPPAPTAEDD